MSSVPQVRGIRGGPIEERWPLNEPPGEQSPVRSAFDLVLDACRSVEDPEFHDGWQPVRARSDAPKSE